MMNYIRNANHASADYKATAKRVRDKMEAKVVREGKGEAPSTMPGNGAYRLGSKERHRHCHSRTRAYGLGNTSGN